MNVLIIHTHDTGRVISPYGYPVCSPNYQAFFDEAIMFQNAFSVAPTCSPSRSGLLTGMYPHQNGMLGLAQRGFKLDTTKHLAHFLGQHGFECVLCGVQHEKAYYTDHDIAYQALGYHQDISSDAKKYSEADLVFWDQENANNLVQWIKEYKKDKPFFVSFGMHSTHRKFPNEINQSIEIDKSTPPSFVENNAISKEDFARYQTSLKMADDHLGLIIKTLKEQNLYEDTIIIVTTDHGIAYPFAKGSLSDKGIGVLLAIRVPQSKLKPSVCDALISQIDIIPTLCDLLSIEKPNYLQGRSFSELFENQPLMENKYVYASLNFHTSYEPVRCVRSKQFKYIRFFDESYLKLNLSNMDNSLVKDYLFEHGLGSVKKEKEYLFNLILDPNETVNLVDHEDYQAILNEYREQLQNYMNHTNDPLLNGPIEISPAWKVNKKQCYSPSSKDVNDYESLGVALKK